MMKRKSDLSKLILDTARTILEEEHPITVRRLHYLLCSSEIAACYPNTPQMYEKLLGLVTKARKNRSLSYEFFDDPTRAVHKYGGWESIGNCVQSVVDCYVRDRWQDQPFRAEIWVEKDGLLGVLRKTARNWQMTLRSMHGQASSTCAYEIAKTFAGYPSILIYVLYYGDQDPAGEDSTQRIGTSEGHLEEGVQNRAHHLSETSGLQPRGLQKHASNPSNQRRRTNFSTKYFEKHGPDAKFAEVDSLPEEELVGRINRTMGELLGLFESEEAWKASVAKEAEEKLSVVAALTVADLYHENNSV